MAPVFPDAAPPSPPSAAEKDEAARGPSMEGRESVYWDLPKVTSRYGERFPSVDTC